MEISLYAYVNHYYIFLFLLQEREGDVERLYKDISQLNNDLSDMENDVREKVSSLQLSFLCFDI